MIKIFEVGLSFFYTLAMLCLIYLVGDVLYQFIINLGAISAAITGFVAGSSFLQMMGFVVGVVFFLMVWLTSHHFLFGGLDRE